MKGCLNYVQKGMDLTYDFYSLMGGYKITLSHVGYSDDETRQVVEMVASVAPDITNDVESVNFRHNEESLFGIP